MNHSHAAKKQHAGRTKKRTSAEINVYSALGVFILVDLPSANAPQFLCRTSQDSCSHCQYQQARLFRNLPHILSPPKAPFAKVTEVRKTDLARRPTDRTIDKEKHAETSYITTYSPIDKGSTPSPFLDTNSSYNRRAKYTKTFLSWDIRFGPRHIIPDSYSGWRDP